ncbi:exo-beta-N-acetylmuramidase NamZ domain-containing protein [Zoogloea sp. LCSB751]|uniref:exo-beta-N-acetylmuramidase NamZ domain-containing protein n=1 Tax=Zoogloea sp. LCSB751 TaxID=1965277 RepID=UPI0020B14683|nr:exo-beta-N-acetylmuramidase NamZ domain-containing protein [Zoogloea sp. LCSB751]
MRANEFAPTGGLLGLLWLLVAVCLSFSAAAAGRLDEAHLDALIAPIVEAEIASRHIPGAVVLVGEGDAVVYRHAFGQRALVPAPEPMTVDTVFDLASLTKVIATTPAVLQLVERGLLTLDAPVARYWPQFAAQGKEAITVRHLLAHTSGLPAGVDIRQAMRPEDVLARIVALKPIARAGGDPLYSDVNFIVLGELVRRVSGLPLDEYGRRRLFNPLGMHDTGFLPPATQLPRIAPTTWNGGGPRRGVVHDPLAARLGGVAGSAGLFGTADDLASFARAVLDSDPRLLTPASLQSLFIPQTYPAASPRSLGWRPQAPLAANRAALPPFGAISHLGYTGTGLWIDPFSGIYVVILSNRVHPNGGGDAAPLRARIIDAIASSLPALPAERIAGADPEQAAQVAPYIPKTVAQPVRTGIDVLEGESFAALRGLRVGLLTNRSGVDAAGRRDIDVLARAPGVTLVALFSPEHGLTADREGRIGDDIDSLSGLPVRSLYGAARRPTAAMLDGLDAVVVDLQDAGVRFYTYASTLAYLMEAAAAQGVRVIVLDRPNPLRADRVQGPLLDAERRGFTGYWPLPIRHGLTLGEFARLFRAEANVDVQLQVIPMQGYRRTLWYDDTGLPWLPPSPNLTSLTATLLYPGVGLIEGAEVSVGRGTPTPFEVVGAPWIDGAQLAAELEALHLDGVHFSATRFQPVAGPYAGETCNGVRVIVDDRDAIDTPALGIALAASLHRLHPRHFTLNRILGNLGSQASLDAIRAGTPPSAIVAAWHDAQAAYLARRAAFLLYP